MQPIRKGQNQVVEKPTDVIYKLTDSNKKAIVHYRNILLINYPKNYAFRELTL